MKEFTVFLDDEGNVVSQDKATKFISRTEDDKGNLIFESFGTMNPIVKEQPTQ